MPPSAARPAPIGPISWRALLVAPLAGPGAGWAIAAAWKSLTGGGLVLLAAAPASLPAYYLFGLPPAYAAAFAVGAPALRQLGRHGSLTRRNVALAGGLAALLPLGVCFAWNIGWAMTVGRPLIGERGIVNELLDLDAVGVCMTFALSGVASALLYWKVSASGTPSVAGGRENPAR